MIYKSVYAFLLKLETSSKEKTPELSGYTEPKTSVSYRKSCGRLEFELLMEPHQSEILNHSATDDQCRRSLQFEWKRGPQRKK